MQKIVPNLWFNRNAQEAINFYQTVFKDFKILKTFHYPSVGLEDFQKDFAGQVLTIDFEIFGQKFTAINADNTFKLSEAVSFLIGCRDQAEIDFYWDKLSSDPQNEQCGWCKDKFGLSWQIIPQDFEEILKKPGAYAKMMQMKKIMIADFAE